MSIELILEIIGFSTISLLMIFRFIQKGNMSIKYSLVWIFSIFLILTTALIPHFMQALATLLGFNLISNMVIAIMIAILMFVCISLTVIVSGLREKIRMLTQEVSLLRKETDDNETR